MPKCLTAVTHEEVKDQDWLNAYLAPRIGTSIKNKSILHTYNAAKGCKLIIVIVSFQTVGYRDHGI